jgi:hypothetical protein
MPVMAIVAAAIMAMAIAAAVVDTEHAVYASNHTADTRTNRAADNTADRPCRAIAPVDTFIRAAFHAPDDALRMCCDRKCQHSQCCGYKRKAAVRRGEHEQSFGLHCGTSPWAIETNDQNLTSL